MLVILLSINIGMTPLLGSNRSFRLIMFSLGIEWFIGHLRLKFTQIAHTIQHFSFMLLILYFLLETTVKHPQTWFSTSFLHILHCVFFFFHYILSIRFLQFRSFFIFILFKVLGMVQCFTFLIFLPPITSFGLVTSIPVGIRVLGVEHL